MTDERPRRSRSRRHHRQRKDRLIQTRVAGPLEEALKAEAGRRRLSVSHLIRNVLEDSFNLVDSVVADVDTLVQDSVDLATQVGREVRDLSRHHNDRIRRDRRGEVIADEPATEAEASDDTAAATADGTAAATADDAAASPAEARVAEAAPTAEADLKTDAEADTIAEAPEADPLGHIYAWNPMVLNRPTRCAVCDAALQRGDGAHLGMSDQLGGPPTWLCDDCVARL